MAGREFRIGIVGASSLAGKELSDALAESALAACDIALLDEDDAAGQVTAAGDEVTFIQKIDRSRSRASTSSSLPAIPRPHRNTGRRRGWPARASST